jgi:hypothetical protein
VRTSLDYYRILELSPLAVADTSRDAGFSAKLDVAYRERSDRQPRREFSRAAIDGRQQILARAYGILHDDRERDRYDSQRSSDGEQLDLSPGIGVLLLLYELGEYEQLLGLALPFIGYGEFRPDAMLRELGPPSEVESDVVLCIALSLREVARQQWSQKEYRSAAKSLDTAQTILAQKGLFYPLQAELNVESCKLRPYQVFELLSTDDIDRHNRQDGLMLLQDMLASCSLEGESARAKYGLSNDALLAYIDRIRCYLTTSEQQNIFEPRAQKDDRVYAYLAAYAAIARGFYYRLPELVRAALYLLKDRLKPSQDVHLEIAVCALLLGNTDAAQAAINKSEDHNAIAYIRKYSLGDPDKLRGLCRYCELWMRTQVFPHFRDLRHQQPQLTAYFEDGSVQQYINRLTADSIAQRDWDWIYEVIIPPLPSDELSEEAPLTEDLMAATTQRGMGTTKAISNPNLGSSPDGDRVQPFGELPEFLQLKFPDLPVAIHLSQYDPAAATEDDRGTNIISLNAERQKRRSSVDGRDSNPSLAAADPLAETPPSLPIANAEVGTLVPLPRLSAVADRRKTTDVSVWRRRKRLRVLQRAAIVSVGSLAILSLTTYAATQAFQFLDRWQKRSPVRQPAATSLPSNSANPILLPDVARDVVDRWLVAKAASLDRQPNRQPLDDILVGNALQRAKETSLTEERRGIHWQYDHRVERIGRVVTTGDRSTVEAFINESAKRLRGDRSLVDRRVSVRVKYSLVKRADRWYISDMHVMDRTPRQP